MAAHLAHKLPWGLLVDLFRLHPAPDPDDYDYYPDDIDIDEQAKKKIDYFTRCFAAAIQEFRESDKSSEEELLTYDPRHWPGEHREHGIGGWAGFFDTLISGYVSLNLILSDAETVMPQISCSYAIKHMLGDFDGGHPRVLVEHLQPAFNGRTLKPMTAEVTQVLRDHAAMLFRCMYSTSGRNKFAEAKMVMPFILDACWLRYREYS